MNSNHLMIVLIVAIVMIAGIFRRRLGGPRRWDDAEQVDDIETQRLREEVKQLKDRVAVLERIATDRESSLEREIEQLRDR